MTRDAIPYPEFSECTNGLKSDSIWCEKMSQRVSFHRRASGGDKLSIYIYIYISSWRTAIDDDDDGDGEFSFFPPAPVYCTSGFFL